MVTYVVALLHGHAARLREFELFIVGTKLTDCLEQNAISELLVQVFNLGEGNGIGWLEKAVTGEMGTNEYMPPLRAEFTVVNQRINIVLVDMRDQELSLKLRLDGCGVLF